VTRRVDTCDPGPERESKERGTLNPSVVGGSLRPREEDDTPAVGPSALRGKIASFGPFRLHATERLRDLVAAANLLQQLRKCNGVAKKCAAARPIS
jgi:hypothetical protein